MVSGRKNVVSDVSSGGSFGGSKTNFRMRSRSHAEDEDITARRKYECWTLGAAYETVIHDYCNEDGRSHEACRSYK